MISSSPVYFLKVMLVPLMSGPLVHGRQAASAPGWHWTSAWPVAHAGVEQARQMPSLE
jgi:hypothetical protein